MHSFFIVSWLVVVAIPLVPLVFFFRYGWKAREAEFVDKAVDDKMDIYFDKFWRDGLADYKKANPGPLDCIAAFRARYESLIGRRRYVAPTILFVATVILLTGLVLATAVRSGYDNYVASVAIEAAQMKAAIDAGPAAASAAAQAAIPRPLAVNLDKRLQPIPPVRLSLSAVSAIAGGYLFIVAQLIQQCRARTLVYSDLFGASLRLVIAVPLGMSMSLLGADAVGPFISFGLGAFPISALRALVRRLTLTQLKVEDPGANDDLTSAMLGVTQSVSDTLAEEGITCAQQLADIDPVVLAVRTGLSFDYVLFLAAQSLVWCFLGKTAGALGPMGYADARAIWFLMRKPPDEQDKVIASIAANLAAGATDKAPNRIDAVLIRQAFEKIAIDPYTIFLLRFTSNLADAPRPGPVEQAASAAGANGAGQSSPRRRPGATAP